MPPSTSHARMVSIIRLKVVNPRDGSHSKVCQDVLQPYQTGTHKGHKATLLPHAPLTSDPAGWVCPPRPIRERMRDVHLAASPCHVLPTHTCRPPSMKMAARHPELSFLRGCRCC